MYTLVKRSWLKIKHANELWEDPIFLKTGDISPSVSIFKFLLARHASERCEWVSNRARNYCGLTRIKENKTGKVKQNLKASGLHFRHITSIDQERGFLSFRLRPNSLLYMRPF